MKKRPLFGATLAILITIVAIAIAPLTIYNVVEYRSFFYEETKNSLLESCSLMKGTLSGKIDSSSKDLQDFTKKLSDESSLRITIIDKDGLVLSDSHNDPSGMNDHSDRPEIIRALNDGEGSSIRHSVSMHNKMMYAAVKIRFTNGKEGTIRLSKSLSDVEEKVKTITSGTLIFCLIVLCISGWISFIIAGKVSIFLRKIKKTTNYYARGEFSEQLFISKPAELSDLSENINRMGLQLKDRIETINEQKNELKMILNNMAEAVLYTDINLHIQRINGAASRLFGIEQERDKGKNLLEFIRSSKFNNFAEDLLASDTPKEAVLTLDLPKSVNLDIRGTILKDKNREEASALLFVMHDITKMVRLEQVRRDFVANVSHELKTPVTMIKGYAETLLDSPTTDPDRMSGFLKIIEKHSLRVEAIINDLLFLSGLEKNDNKSLQREKIQAIDLVTSAVSGCTPKADEKNININIDCDESIIIEVYPLLAEQAVINLVDNAVKYSERGTSIKVSIRQLEDGKCRISVKDHGCGISEEQQSRIFERFYRVDKARSRESGGTGLGLSIVKHIALTHNGSIEVKSKIGGGAEFILCI